MGRVHVQGTVKQIEADRYGNDSRGGGGIVKCAEGVGRVSVFQTTRRKGALLGCGNKGVTRSFFSFLSFSPRLNIPTLTISQQTLRYTLPSSRFPSTCPLLTHLSSSNLFFLNIPNSALSSPFSWVLIILLGQRHKLV